MRTGGGANHRFNLSDGVLIKDNHIRAAGGITQAVEAVRKNAPHTLRIEVETETLDEVREAFAAGADIIMLDNMDNERMREAVGIIAGRAVTEASGNMGDRDLRAVAETGVDVISIGAISLWRMASTEIMRLFFSGASRWMSGCAARSASPP